MMLASAASGQTNDSQRENGAAGSDQVAAARSQYDGPTDVLHDGGDRAILAQFPRRGPGPPFPPGRGYARRENYQTPWMDHGDAGHAAIGAAIGFGIGAAVGALGGIHNHTPIGDGVVLGGSLFALIGGAIGASHGGPHYFAHHRRSYRPSWSDDDEKRNAQSSSGKERGEGVTMLASPLGQEPQIRAGGTPSAVRAVWRETALDLRKMEPGMPQAHPN